MWIKNNNTSIYAIVKMKGPIAGDPSGTLMYSTCLSRVSRRGPYVRMQGSFAGGPARALFFLILLLTLFFSGCHQKDSVTAFRENHPIDLALTFYPSTLRMINLAKNEDFNQLIKDIEKGRYYKVNKKEDTQQAIHTLTQGLLEEGYEEIMTVTGNANDMAVYALERHNPVMVVIVEREEDYAIIQVEGMINIVQIPKLINSFNDEEFLNIFSIYDQKKPRQNIESDTTNNPAE